MASSKAIAAEGFLREFSIFSLEHINISPVNLQLPIKSL